MKHNLSNFNRHYPATRLRRVRQHEFIRDLVRENALSIKDLIYPVFIVEGIGQKQPIESMPNIFRFSIDRLLDELQEVTDLGIPAVALFPKIEQGKKTLSAEESYNPEGLVQQAIMQIKNRFPQLGVMTDIALDPYTSHGQDGILDKNGYIVNDPTIEILIKQALSHAKAGADILGPSDMMDGRIRSIRTELESANFVNIRILSYAAKYASSFYSPFRNAIGSAANLKQADKHNYQMDIANSDEAMHEIALDIAEGADMIMVKPGLLYLDIIHRAKSTFGVPTFAFHVSGEFAMLQSACQQGLLKEKPAVMECLISFKRAGADGILTYCAKKVAQWLA